MLFPRKRARSETFPPEEIAFRGAIVAAPEDDATRLVYADWLEEHGQDDRARFVRLEVEASRLPPKEEPLAALCRELNALGEEVGDQWSAALDRPARVLNCGDVAGPRDVPVRFAFECPLRWADLQPTDDARVRFCGQCNELVHACASQPEADHHALLGHCIAVSARLALAVEDARKADPGDEDDDATMTMGLVMLPEHLSSSSHEPPRPARKRWWQFWK